MELRKFIEKYGGQLVKKIEENMTYIYDPLRPEGVFEFEQKIPALLLRPPYPVQGEIIKGLSKALFREGQNRLFLVGEMGTGKTFISLSVVSMSPKPLRVLVVCPGHLVEKWMRESRETIPDVEIVNLSVKNVISVLEGLRKIKRRPEKTEIYVISKERAKLSYPWRGTANSHRWSRMPYCPRCGEIPKGKNGYYITGEEIKKRRLFCHCGEALWQADSKLRRFAPSEYIKRYLRRFFDLVILDEIQDYKAGESLQGQAMGMLLGKKTKCLCLTGTLNGGYADDIFYLLYRMEPGVLAGEGFEYHRSGQWLEAYGTIEYERKLDEENEEGHYYGRGSRRRGVITRKRPGVSPLVIGKYLLSKSCFIRLADVIEGLPPYEERVVALKMTDIQGALYKELEEKLKRAIKAHKQKALSSMLQSLLSYPDSCVAFEERVVIRDRSSERVLEVIRAPKINAELLPKEEELLKVAREEIAEGRKVLCYLTFTGTRDLRPRLKGVLENAGFRVGVLDVSVSPQKREAWIEKHASEIDILLVNAELVKTGLDLYEFPTVVFFQTGYNIYSLRQAARRSWRIGQKRPVKVLFLCYEKTMQSIALSLIAKKLEVALIVEGDLPEGLAEYAVDSGSVLEEMGRALIEGGEFTGAEAAWAKFRKKELEIQLGLTEKEKIFETRQVTKTAPVENIRTSIIDENVIIKVSIIEGKKKKQSVVEVRYGDLDKIAEGRPVQFCLF